MEIDSSCKFLPYHLNIPYIDHEEVIENYISELSRKGITITNRKALFCARLFTLEKPSIHRIIYSILRDIVSEDNFMKQNAHENLKEWKTFITFLQCAVFEIPGFDEDVIVYRGQSILPPDIEKYETGDEIVWTTFSTCTTNESISKVS